MQTVNLNPSSTPKTLPLGIRGENAVSEVVFDYSAWASEYGEGVVTLLVKRSEDANPYPVVLDIDTEKHTATWTVSQTDVCYRGRGEVEWSYYIDEQIAKTSVFRTFVERDIGEEITPPDPYETWLDTLTELAAETQEAAQEAIVRGVPSGGSTGQVLAKKTDTDFDIEWVDQSGGGSDYSTLENKPQIGGTTLVGNKTLPELGIEPTALVVNVTQNGSSYTADHTYNEINTARLAGKRIYAVLSFVVYQFYGRVDNAFVFCSIDANKVKVISFPYRASITYTETNLDSSVVYVTYGTEARETIHNAIQAQKAVICVCDDISPNGTLYLPISSCGSDTPSQWFSCQFSVIDDQQGELHFYNVIYWDGDWSVADYTISTS